MIYISRKKYYKIINQFQQFDDAQDVMAFYPKVWDAMCRYNFKLPKRIIKDMFEDLGYGNWLHLWETDKEKARTIDELCSTLKSEVWYCSDRMSWDRLIRIHWIWQCIQHRVIRGRVDRKDED